MSFQRVSALVAIGLGVFGVSASAQVPASPATPTHQGFTLQSLLTHSIFQGPFFQQAEVICISDPVQVNGEMEQEVVFINRNRPYGSKTAMVATVKDTGFAGMSDSIMVIQHLERDTKGSEFSEFDSWVLRLGSVGNNALNDHTVIIERAVDASNGQVRTSGMLVRNPAFVGWLKATNPARASTFQPAQPLDCPRMNL